MVKAKQNSHGKSKETIDPKPWNKTCVLKQLSDLKRPYKNCKLWKHHIDSVKCKTK